MSVHQSLFVKISFSFDIGKMHVYNLGQGICICLVVKKYMEYDLNNSSQ